MKDDHNSPTTISPANKEGSLETSNLLGKIRCKFWVLSAITLLAFWSMFTGSVTLKSSAGNLTHFSDDVGFPIHDDLDILEMEERVKVVRHMWDVYIHGSSIGLPRFWQEAFEAGYEYLVSDVPGVQDAAVFEIAKISMLSINLDHVPFQMKRKRAKQTKENNKVDATGTSKEQQNTI